MEVQGNNNLDLPLSANKEEVYVHHYIFDLRCNMQTHEFEGIAVFFVEGQNKPSSDIQASEAANSVPCIILDSFALEVKDCWMIDLMEHEKTNIKSNFFNGRQSKLRIDETCMEIYIEVFKNSCFDDAKKTKLPLSFKEHFIKIAFPHLQSWKNEQVVLLAHYKTQACPSVMWTLDQENK